jgi:hypothetical protein
MRGQQQDGQRDEQFRVCPREREREGMALPSRHVPSVADTRAWAPRHHPDPWSHGRAALRPGPRSCVVQNGERAMAAASPHGPVRAWRVLPCALRNETANEMEKRCWLRSASASDETSEVRKPAADEARAPNRDMAVSLARARHPVLTLSGPIHPLISRSLLLERDSPFARPGEEKFKQEMNVLLKLPHMASPSHGQPVAPFTIEHAVNVLEP